MRCLDNNTNKEIKKIDSVVDSNLGMYYDSNHKKIVLTENMKTRASKVLSKISSKIIPDNLEISKMKTKINHVFNIMNDSASKEGFDVSIELGGSAAKDTFLSNDFDCDVFVRFNYGKYSSMNDDISSFLKKILIRSGFKFVELHGSRNYFQFVYEGIKYELVPVLKIPSIKDIALAKNVTDSSPFHVYWFNEMNNSHKSDMTDKLNNQVRLTKLFCKSQRVYGAESYVGGFSGHVIDILIVYFGSFIKLCEYFAAKEELISMKKYDSQKSLIDVSDFYSGMDSLEVQNTLNSSKIDSPLIVIDPISKERNASSSLTIKKYNQMILSCRRFLEKPSEDFFKVNTFSESYLNSLIHSVKDDFTTKGIDVYGIVAKVMPLSGKKDIVGAKIKKILDYMSKKILEKGFELYDSDFELVKQKGKTNLSLNDCEDYSESYIWFIVDKSDLESEVLWAGPPKTVESHAKKFREEHKNDKIVEVKGKLFAKMKRDFVNLYDFIKTFEDDSFVKEKCSSIDFYKI